MSPRPDQKNRNLEIVRLINEEHIPAAEVGRRMELTRERVRQIYTDFTGTPIPRRPLDQPPITNICAYCGKEYQGEWRDRRKVTMFREHAIADHPYWRNNRSYDDQQVYPHRTQKILEMFERGLLYQEIGARMGMSEQNVHSTVTHLGLRRYTPRKKDWLKIAESVMADRMSGMSEKELVQKYPGTSIPYILRYQRGQIIRPR